MADDGIARTPSPPYWAVIFTSRRDLMGDLVNRRLTTAVATIVTGLIISLNVFLLYQTFFG